MVTPRQAHRPPLRLPLEAYTAVTTATYTAKAGDRLIGVNRAGAVTITLPTAEVRAGRSYTVKDESGNAFANNITVATEGSETIDGAATSVVSSNYGTSIFYSDGSNWFLVPNPRIEDLLDQDQWIDFHNFSGASEVLTGSGVTSRTLRRMQVDSGSTATSTALAKTIGSMALSSGKAQDVVNWSKNILMYIIFRHIADTTNGITRFTLGKHGNDNIGVLTDKGIGFEVVSLAIKGLVHDGTSGATIDLSTTLVTNQVYTITIVSDGAGNIEWFINKVSKGTSAAGPTGDSTSGHAGYQLETDNGGDAANQKAEINSMKMYVEQ